MSDKYYYREPQIDQPFSNGTSVMNWMDRNCDQCGRNGDKGGFDHETLLEMVEMGTHCNGEYAIVLSSGTGTILKEIAEWIGWDEETGWPQNCRNFRADWYPPGHPLGPVPPPPISDNQLVMPFDPIYLHVGRKPVACGLEM